MYLYMVEPPPPPASKNNNVHEGNIRYSCKT